MNIKKTQKGNQITLKLSGKLNTSTAPKLQEELIPSLSEGVVVTLDLSELEYVSSAGLRVLLMGEKTAKAKGSRQVLTRVPEVIMEVLYMTELSGVFNIE